MKNAAEINDSLPDLWIGIAIYTLLAIGIGVWFVDRPLYCLIGLLCGSALAAFCAWHMARSIDRAVSYDEGEAVRSLQKGSMLRYGVILIVIGVLFAFDLGNPIAALVGVFGLKVSAYLAPFTHKIFRR
ncbi:MAG: ATP synthase subunit I [Lachnospiraceae bacterium]|nr:ATP synthase subunit I [Lachnospiraceae bacterium]